MTRHALDALAVRLDRTRAAAATITRKRAVFHGCLGYAAELGLLAANPLGHQISARTADGVHVITTESFAGDPVDADTAGLQTTLGNSLTAWLIRLKQKAESFPSSR